MSSSLAFFSIRSLTLSSYINRVLLSLCTFISRASCASFPSHTPSSSYYIYKLASCDLNCTLYALLMYIFSICLLFSMYLRYKQPHMYSWGISLIIMRWRNNTHLSNTDKFYISNSTSYNAIKTTMMINVLSVFVAKLRLFAFHLISFHTNFV